MKLTKLMSLIVCFLFILALPQMSFAQEIEMADVMRSNGKIYVVVSVVLVILIGIFIYIFQTDKKLKKLEDDLNSLKKKV